MKVLKVEVNKLPKVIEIDGNLESLQKEVGGYIEPMYAFEEEACIICNEEGKINGMFPNRAIVMDGEIVDVVYGDFIIVGLGEDDFTDLPENLQEKFLKQFERKTVIIS